MSYDVIKIVNLRDLFAKEEKLSSGDITAINILKLDCNKMDTHEHFES